VHDEAAYLFVRGFFRSLGCSARLGEDYRSAFEQGKSAVTEKKRRVRTRDAGSDEVPYFTLSNPEDPPLPNCHSFAAGVPVMFMAEPREDYA